MKCSNIILLIPVLTFMVACGGKSGQSSEDGSASAQDSILESVKNVDHVVGVGLVVPQNLISDLSSELSGKVVQISKQIGDHVDSGEVILKLDDTGEQLTLEKLKRQKQTQRHQIDAVRAGIKSTRINLKNEEQNLNAVTDLAKTGAETQQELEDLQTKVESLKAQLDEKTANLSVAVSQLKTIETDIEKATDNLNKKVLKAPSGGQILKMNAVLNNNVNQNETLVTFAPDGPVIVRCEIDEMFASQVEVGQPAVIRNIGFEKVIAGGTVILVSPYLSPKSLFTESPTEKQDRRVRDVRVRIDNPKDLLFNSRVECTIKTGK